MKSATLATYLAVGIGAGFGGVCRYALTLLFVSRYGPGFPFGTFFINISGSFLIGVLAAVLQTRAVGIEPLLRIGLTAGFLGGYTTFSTFAFETLTLGGEREWRLALAYGFGSVVLGVAACYLGVVAARLMERPA
ncbi:MAG TPA: fluoride efflux transporter CrcB [Candidatus Cybelea sp.]|jgi:CrcB protein|nr:fluoride efflux transporter CrcB [Candidatus Cybelea sp.]